ncbi:lipooligosaccharide galactosyltransferase I [Xenorhabdus stockiae]|uniref:Lipooligosaccharide galactosyltransferase I n=1 Tax=Xenorhabdus stockiae TaxID=351614 RepID=A0A2D0KAZ7_9GAMM|nr:glycosyltransferase family 25 protein [Xenorhabdus stockiae]PHM60601.1 lipooligosaccharide galactosyltransferase I [Xenorhabdus stockiae]
MNIFVINLAKDTERRESIKKQAETLGLQIQFIEAINGKNLSDTEINKFCRNFHDNGLTHGVLGCSLSHLKVYEKIISENLDVALILEDDVNLSKEITNIYNSICNYNLKNKNTPLIYLLSITNEYIDSFKKKLSPKYFLVDVIDADYAYGYIINNVAAKKLVKFLNPVWIEADKWRFMQERGIVKIKAVIPPIITATDLSIKSTLEDDRSITLQKRIDFFNDQYENRNLKVKIRALLWRIFIRSWVERIKP